MHQDCWLLYTLKNHRQLLYLDPFFGVQTPIKPKIRIPLTKDNKMYAKVAVFIATGHSRRFLIGNVESQSPGMVGTDLSSALLPLVWQLILIIMIDELFLAARRSTHSAEDVPRSFYCMYLIQTESWLAGRNRHGIQMYFPSTFFQMTFSSSPAFSIWILTQHSHVSWTLGVILVGKICIHVTRGGSCTIRLMSPNYLHGNKTRVNLGTEMHNWFDRRLSDYSRCKIKQNHLLLFAMSDLRKALKLPCFLIINPLWRTVGREWLLPCQGELIPNKRTPLLICARIQSK